MNKKLEKRLGPLPENYVRLVKQLGQSGWFCQGTVVRRPIKSKVGGKWEEKGPYYMWTAKRAGKTVCHALSEEQYEVAKEAIEVNQQIQAIIAELQAMSLKQILEKMPGVRKRKKHVNT